MVKVIEDCRNMRQEDVERLHSDRMRYVDTESQTAQEKAVPDAGSGTALFSQAMMFERSPHAEARFLLMRQLVTDLYEALGDFIEGHDSARTPIGFQVKPPEPAEVSHLTAYCRNLLALVNPMICQPAPSQSQAVLQAYAKALKPLLRSLKALLTENSQIYGVPEGRLALVVFRLRKYEQALSEFVTDLNNIWGSLTSQKEQVEAKRAA